jgi:hypothetical protein
MTLRTPPKSARSLLERLGPADRRESLVGDLTEQYQRGRSSLWFWRQSLMTILIGAARDLRRDTGQVMHAVVTGVGVVVLYVQVAFLPLTAGVGYLVSGSKFWRAAWWLQWAIFFPLNFSGGVLAGWLVARFHRPQLAAALSLLAGTWIAMDLPSLWRLAPDAWGYPNYRYQLALNLGQLFCMVLGIFVGGLSRRTPAGQTTLDALVP